MPATKPRATGTRTALTPTPQTLATTAHLVFDALGGMHRLTDHDAELLRRAAAGLRFIRSKDTYSETDIRLFRIALADLTPADAFVVETAASYGADVLPDACVATASRSCAHDDERRALWLAAILRFADGLCGTDPQTPTGVFATWADSVLYLEFDGVFASAARFARARSRATALEALTGRVVVLAGSESRRGAA